MKKIILFSVLIFAVCNASSQTTADSTVKAIDTVSIVQIDSSELYGFIQKIPVKVGGGPVNQRKYLESLRDAQGKRISYERQGSCCPYPSTSPTAMFGGGILDIYEITYRDEKNKKKKINVYITFYDYETPKAIKGFTLTE
jgi:hypothetical protein